MSDKVVMHFERISKAHAEYPLDHNPIPRSTFTSKHPCLKKPPEESANIEIIQIINSSGTFHLGHNEGKK